MKSVQSFIDAFGTKTPIRTAIFAKRPDGACNDLLLG